MFINFKNRAFLKSILFTAILASFHSCESELQKSTVYSIAKDFVPYMETFIDEAEKRGIKITQENLIVEFGDTSLEICGECINSKGVGQRIVRINSEFCWQQVPQENREALIFHELGHCLLARSHKDDLLPIGAYASIMSSENSAPYGPCIYQIGDPDCNKISRRSYYIDELFDPETSIPDWGN